MIFYMLIDIDKYIKAYDIGEEKVRLICFYDRSLNMIHVSSSHLHEYIKYLCVEELAHLIRPDPFFYARRKKLNLILPEIDDIVLNMLGAFDKISAMIALNREIHDNLFEHLMLYKKTHCYFAKYMLRRYFDIKRPIRNKGPVPEIMLGVSIICAICAIIIIIVKK